MIRHQKNHCFKEENNKKSAKAQIAAAQIAHSLSSEDSNSSMEISNMNCMGSNLAPTIISSSTTSLAHSESGLGNTSGVGSLVSGVGGGGNGGSSLGINCGGNNSALTSIPDLSVSPNLNILGTQKMGSHGNTSGSHGMGMTVVQSQSSNISSDLSSSNNNSNENSINGSFNNAVNAKSSNVNKYECEKCNIVFPRLDVLKEHQILHMMNPSFFLNQNYGEHTPFGILQHLSKEPQRNDKNKLNGSEYDEPDFKRIKLDLTRKKSISDNEQNSFMVENDCKDSVKSHEENYDSNIYNKCKSDQYDFLYEYFMHNTDQKNEENNFNIEKKMVNEISSRKISNIQSSDSQDGIPKNIDLEFLFNFYQNNEIKKNCSYEILLQYYIKNEKLAERGQNINFNLSEKLNFEFLLQYYQLNESKKIFQINVPTLKLNVPQPSYMTSSKNAENVINLTEHSVKSPFNTNSPQSGSLDTLNSTIGSTSDSDLILNSADKQNSKRLRTTILPEQLNFLYECYQNESNPSRKMLEEISKKVNLKKRVVQVGLFYLNF